MRLKTRAIILVFCLCNGMASMAQQSTAVAVPESGAASVGMLDNWFVQAGLDMSLQNPYGYNFANVFPNGKTFGVDVAVGKWFTQALGFRVKLNWENGIGLFRNDHANWLAPFDEPGTNMDKGGYIGFYGDLMFNVHSMFWGYDAERFWTLAVFPRAGFDYNCGVEKGSPLLGIGIANTFRISDKVGLYFDLAYNAVSSGHVGVVETTGLNSNSNGYFTIDAGVQLNLGQQTAVARKDLPLRSGWFAQAGMDMHLMNPYGCNFFAGVFPNGKTFGLEAALGKKIAPLLTLRGKVDWANGLLKNGHLTWVVPVDNPEENYKKGGYITLNLDPMMNLHNLFTGIDCERKWNTYVYPRAGVIRTFAESSDSPLLGLGIENTYRLNDRVSLYADVDYQVTTSDAMYGKTGMEVNTGVNGFFGIHAGVQIDLGRKAGN